MEIEDLDEIDDAPPAKPSLIMGILFSVGGAVLLGGVAAGVVMFMPGGEPAHCPVVADGEHAEPKKKPKNYEDIIFVDLEPLVISLGPTAASEYLKISVSIETSQEHMKTATHLTPRFRDTLNSYLRAVNERDLSDPVAMTRLRAQMLRRLQVAASSDIVTDVLITDFVLN